MNENTDEKPEGLRAQKRLNTWLTLHEQAHHLARERSGLASVTVDEIAEGAGVSRRTFFNYFATKEDALLGMHEPFLAAEALDHFDSSDDDLFTRTMRLLLSVLWTMYPSYDVAQGLHQRLNEFPELRERNAALISSCEELVSKALSDRLDDRGNALTEQPLRLRALLMIAGTIVRFATRFTPEGLMQDPTQTMEETIELFRSAISETFSDGQRSTLNVAFSADGRPGGGRNRAPSGCAES